MAPRILRRILPFWLLGLVVACATAPNEPPDVLLQEGKEYFDQGRLDRARNWMRALTVRWPTSYEAEAASFYLAETYRLKDASAGALAAYKDFAERYPNSRYSVDAAEGEYRFGVRHLDGEIGGWFIFGANYGSGIKLLDHMQLAYRNHSLADDALMHIARYQMKEKQYEEAIDTCRRLLADYPRRENTLEARFVLARALWLVNRGAPYDERSLQRAVVAYRDFIASVQKAGQEERRARHTKRAEKAIGDIRETLAEKQVLIGEFYERRKQTRSAVVYYEYCIREYPETKHADKAQDRLEALRSIQRAARAAAAAKKESES